MIEEIKKRLRTRILVVSFTKKNGEHRDMLCTLHPEVIPNTPGEPRNTPGIITVYDIEQDDWRCFREDSVICYEDVTEEGPAFWE